MIAIRAAAGLSRSLGAHVPALPVTPRPGDEDGIAQAAPQEAAREQVAAHRAGRGPAVVVEPQPEAARLLGA